MCVCQTRCELGADVHVCCQGMCICQRICMYVCRTADVHVCVYARPAASWERMCMYVARGCAYASEYACMCVGQRMCMFVCMPAPLRAGSGCACMLPGDVHMP